ncbi:MAG: aspartate carbamoyltransferase catalytic subunit [Planctomycetota bacterium]
MEWTRKDLVGLQGLSKDELILLLDTARSFEPISTRSLKKAAALRGKVVVNLFFENSTRTANSFALAAQRLSADVLQFNASASSVSKGETLLDTARNIEAMGVDAFVMRHPVGGTPEFLARHVDACVINAGDGGHEHPTQGLLDIYTIRKKYGKLDGVKVAIVGDIRHSRVARSNAWGLRKLGAEVWFVGPPTLLPRGIEALDVKLCSDLDKALAACDVINLLRVQLERAAGNFFPSISEYAAMYGVSEARLRRAGRDHMVMHPGPINRGVELQPEVADGKASVILQQVAHGVAVRMAVLYLCVGAREKARFGTPLEPAEA